MGAAAPPPAGTATIEHKISGVVVRAVTTGVEAPLEPVVSELQNKNENFLFKSHIKC